MEFLKNFNVFEKLCQSTFDNGHQNSRYQPKKGSFWGSKLKKIDKNLRWELDFDPLANGVFEKFQWI